LIHFDQQQKQKLLRFFCDLGKNRARRISFHDGFWIGFHAASWLFSSIGKFACPVDIPQSFQHANMLGRENDWPDYIPASEPIKQGSILTRLHGRMPGGHPLKPVRWIGGSYGSQANQQNIGQGRERKIATHP
jgi:hypothetical protein